MGMSSESSNLGTQPDDNRGAFVTCTDLTYKVRVRGRRGGWKTIVQGLNMYLGPREMTVVMGPSGSGEKLLAGWGVGGGGRLNDSFDHFKIPSIVNMT